MVAGNGLPPAGTWSSTREKFRIEISPPLKNPGFPGFLQTRSAPERKWLPFTVRVNAAPPAVALMGEMEEITGAGPGVEVGRSVSQDCNLTFPRGFQRG